MMNVEHKIHEMLEVVDENDRVLRLESREKIHKEGLLHREVHVWFVTAQGVLILQHRSKSKDTYADMLDATVGGHVEPLMTYEESAIKEAMEETGIAINPIDLITLATLHKRTVDEKGGAINSTIRTEYAYVYNGDVKDLLAEKGKSEGFEEWHIETLMHPTDEQRKLFIPTVLDLQMLSMLQTVAQGIPAKRRVAICGSMHFWDDIERVRVDLESAGYIVFTPSKEGTDIDYTSLTYLERIRFKKLFIDRHIERIRCSDAVLVLNVNKNGIENYIGANTFMEMAFAYLLEKKIYLYNPIPNQSNDLEIAALQPIVINADVSKI